jgi:hypothetical protein
MKTSVGIERKLLKGSFAENVMRSRLAGSMSVDDSWCDSHMYVENIYPTT